MCQLIAKKAGFTIPKSALKLSWLKNPDGAGFAYSKDGKIKVEKGFLDSFEEFWKAYLPHEQEQCLIHFRLASHGSICMANCHPFEIVNGQLVMGHNGVINDFTPTTTDKDRSDTRIFVEDYVKKLANSVKNPMNWLDSLFLAIRPVVRFNRIVFMAATDPDRFFIFNEKAGEWEKGVWWSNGVGTRGTYGYGVPKGYAEWIDTPEGGRKRIWHKDPDLADVKDSFDNVTWYGTMMGMGGDMSDYEYDHHTGTWVPKDDAVVEKHVNMTRGPDGTVKVTESIKNLGTTTHTPSDADKRILNAMFDYEQVCSKKISEHTYWGSLYLLYDSEFKEFLKYMCQEQDGYDRDLDAALRKDKKDADEWVRKGRQSQMTTSYMGPIQTSPNTGIRQIEPYNPTGTNISNTTSLLRQYDEEERRKENKRGTGRGRTHVGPTYPPWLADQFRQHTTLAARVDSKFIHGLAKVGRGFIINGVIYSRAEAKRRTTTICEWPKEQGLYSPAYNGQHMVDAWTRVAGPEEAKVLSLKARGVKDKPVASPAPIDALAAAARSGEGEDDMASDSTLGAGWD